MCHFYEKEDNKQREIKQNANSLNSIVDNFTLNLYLFPLCVCALSVCIQCAETLEPLELELQVFVSRHVGAGI